MGTQIIDWMTERGRNYKDRVKIKINLRLRNRGVLDREKEEGKSERKKERKREMLGEE